MKNAANLYRRNIAGNRFFAAQEMTPQALPFVSGPIRSKRAQFLRAIMAICFGIIVSVSANAQQNPLFSAIDQGNEDLVLQLLDRGADPDAEGPGEGGNSALMHAIFVGNLRIVEGLIEHGADVNFRNEQKATPLMLAAVSGQKEVCRFLFEKGAKLNSKEYRGKTALMLAVDRSDTTIVNMLCGLDVDLDARDKYYHMTALAKATVLGQLAIMDTLLRKGADVDCELLSGVTPVMIASAFGNMPALELLLKHGADPNKHDGKFRFMPSEHASFMSGGWVTYKSYLEPKVYDFTALMYAAAAGHVNVVKELLKRGADVGKKNSANETAADLAKKEGYSKIVRILGEADDANPEPEMDDSSLQLTIPDDTLSDQRVIKERTALVRIWVDNLGAPRYAYVIGMNTNLLQLFFVKEELKRARNVVLQNHAVLQNKDGKGMWITLVHGDD